MYPAAFINADVDVVRAGKHVFNSFSALHVLLSSSDTQNSLVVLLRDIGQRYSQEFQSAVMSLPLEQRTKISTSVAQS